MSGGWFSIFYLFYLLCLFFHTFSKVLSLVATYTDRHIHWQTHTLTDTYIHWQTHTLTDTYTDRHIHTLTDTYADRHIHWQTHSKYARGLIFLNFWQRLAVDFHRRLRGDLQNRWERGRERERESVCVCSCIRTHTRTHTLIHVYVFNLSLYVHTHTSHLSLYTHTHHIYTHTHTHTHTHTFIHTQRTLPSMTRRARALRWWAGTKRTAWWRTCCRWWGRMSW
jgi:hypothetical protein